MTRYYLVKAGQFHREEHFCVRRRMRRRSDWRESYRDAIPMSRPARFDFYVLNYAPLRGYFRFNNQGWYHCLDVGAGGTQLPDGPPEARGTPRSDADRLEVV
jgi:hypothetical protein